MKKKITPSINIALLLTSIVIAITGLMVAVTALSLHVQNDDDNLWNDRLIFACYNYEIQPCDDEAVTKWNKENPDKAITAEYLRSEW